MRSLYRAMMRYMERTIEGVGRARARRELLQLDDWLLADAGFSRELLEHGVDAWPWRAGHDASEQPGAETANAVAELRAYRDEELNDLGIARAEIERAVREGRPGLDAPERAAA